MKTQAPSSKLQRTSNRAHLDTASGGPRTVPVRSGLAGVKALEFSRPPRPRDVLRAGTARAPVAVSRCAPSELEMPKATAAWPLPGVLELGIWTFYGAWSLGFGASALSLHDSASQD